jgi:hypothetical protein
MATFSVIDFNMKTKEKVVLKEQQVLGENLIRTTT